MTDRYDYSVLSVDTIRRDLEEGIAAADRLIGAAVAPQPARTYENTILPLLEAAHVVARTEGRTASMGLVHPVADVREAGTAAAERLDKWRASMFKRDDLAAAATAYAETDEAAALPAARRRVLDLLLRDLERAGHGLDPTARAELARLDDRMAELRATFGHNVGEWTDELVLGPGDLDGLAASFVEQLPEGQVPGSRRLRITASVVWPFIEQSTRRDLREAALRKYLSRAVEANRPILDELLDLRRRAARLHGRVSWSDFANGARMSGDAAAVNAFLDRLIEPLGALAADERGRMRAMLAADGVDDELRAWDWPHYHERGRREIGLDSAELSAHYALDGVLQGLFDIVREVFGVIVREETETRVWHPDVRLFALEDADTGERLAELYVDLFARDGKRPGAWQAWLDPPVNRAGAPRRHAVLQLVTNFAPPPADGGPALLQHDDVETVFHEFGHVLEFGLARAEGVPLAFDWVELDFVEAPSQIMEHWVWSPEVLMRFARHHATGQPPSEELLERLVATRNLHIGTSTLYLYAYRAVLDQLLHAPDPIPADEAYRRAFAVTGLPFVEGTFQPSSFDHIVSLYDAGFYSYLWAQVFGDDMFGVFRSEGMLSGEIGRRYRCEVLEPSWSVPGRERVRRFTGREPSDAAFLDRLGIVTTPAG